MRYPRISPESSPGPASNNPKSAEERRKAKVKDLLHRSIPSEQFEDLVEEEAPRQWRLDPETIALGKEDYSWWRRDYGDEFMKKAQQAVRDQWIQQGIWNQSWDEDFRGELWPSSKWKHQQSQVRGRGRGRGRGGYTPSGEPSRKKPRSNAAEEATSRVEESEPTAKPQSPEQQRSTADCNREASRPINMFLWQVNKEAERLLAALPEGDEALWNRSANIYSKAYETVKQSWIERELWTPEWDPLPGRTWKHEHPVVETFPEVATAQDQKAWEQAEKARVDRDRETRKIAFWNRMKCNGSIRPSYWLDMEGEEGDFFREGDGWEKVDGKWRRQRSDGAEGYEYL
ncbi:hypothetical protein MGN70_004600 [Eutypa lata]|nr:hypothetical protein MGN70_004600 [Eutypa lata]